jgi:hypothetical protein
MTFTPPQMATVLSPDTIAWRARWRATNELAQAASTAVLGPLKSRWYDILLEMPWCAVPIPLQASIAGKSSMTMRE